MVAASRIMPRRATAAAAADRRRSRRRRRVGALGGAQLGRARARIGGDLRFVGHDRASWSARGRSAAACTASGGWREPALRAAARRRGTILTMRSSSEWNETTTSRPPGLSMRSAAASAAASSSSSSLTKMRSAWNVRVAGWMAPGRACTTRATISASARVVADRRVVARRDDGARDGARMALLAERRDDRREIALGRRGHHIGRARAVAAHAHVERTVEPEREAALGLVELHRRHAEVEHDAVDRVVAAAARDAFEIGEAILDQRQPAVRLADTDRRRARSRCWSRSMPITRQSAAARMARV